MKRSPTTALVAAALAVVVSAGAAAPAATAAPHGNHRPAAAAKTGHRPVAQHAKHAKPVKSKADQKRLAVEQRKVTTWVAHKDAALARAAVRVAAAGLAEGDVVAATIAADREALAALGTEASAAATPAEVKAIGKQVKQVRPEIYSIVLTGLRRAAAMQQQALSTTDALAELTTQTDAAEVAGADVAAIRESLAAATAANDSVAGLVAAAVEKGIALTASSSHQERAAFLADLAAAGGQLDLATEQLQVIADALAALTVTPVVEEPVVEDPPVVEPVV
ncbi:hypothetical protein [Nocardioides mesophilus]|uniref:Uncharacterized protein n=1 Tax=Nocardioides mesophilus TaxID=433659 RepID=A0A7G9R9V8_9ACTN|nr:hypothetical protein [Nocardioides mesophilus]QNN52383.1 hypothetical protein H9L09_18180 [Nocardioides mesophilus]